MKIIGIDDGHGLKTSGKQTPDGYKENEFNHYTKEYLELELKFNGFKVIDVSPTRNDDSLSTRVKHANIGKCDMFISIHYNAMGNKWQTGAGGIETYYHGKSTYGKKIAEKIHAELIKGTSLNNRGVKSDTTIYKNGFYVLRETTMPAVLVECGFMDNKVEALLMKSKAYRKECSKEICKGICSYYGIKYKDRDKEPKTSNRKDYETILKEVSKWSKNYLDDLKIIHKDGHNWKGLIEKLYYTKPK